MLVIDGSSGEGGGQILRTSLALSLVTGTPFHIHRIRAGRKKPGLLQQHLTAVKAAARVGNAEVAGAEIGSQALTFRPGAVLAGEYRFSVGTAGSATLVLQTVLAPLLTAGGASALTLEGGTHNPFAPPFDFIERAFLPIVQRMGAAVSATLERPGFYPAGGGEFSVKIEPARRLTPIDLLERGPLRRRAVKAIVARLPRHIGEREIDTIRQQMSDGPLDCEMVEAGDSRGPGNVVMIVLESEHVTEVFTGFGQRGVPAEDVARQAVGEAQRYLEAEVPVGEHLADQLLVPFALAGRGAFGTVGPTGHTRTNMGIIRDFLAIRVLCERVSGEGWVVSVG